MVRIRSHLESKTGFTPEEIALGAAVSISYAQEPEQYTPNYRK
jgi:hypothetical protein